MNKKKSRGLETLQSPDTRGVTDPRCGISAARHQQVKSWMKVQIIGRTQVSVVVPDDLIETSTNSGPQACSAELTCILEKLKSTFSDILTLNIS